MTKRNKSSDNIIDLLVVEDSATQDETQKYLLEKHSGKICVESEEGKGSTLRFTIPVKSRGLDARSLPRWKRGAVLTCGLSLSLYALRAVLKGGD